MSGTEVEKYQLKWNSFSSYLHTCVSSAIHNEAFADVALVTTDGFQIMAHRFVLSYSSQYIHEILKFQPKVTTALPLMIVLPSEINFKTLKILIKYMYSGEATVTKDILDNVLKGGDILKVKGLWRPENETVSRPERSRSVASSSGVSNPASSPVTQAQAPSTSQSTIQTQKPAAQGAAPKQPTTLTNTTITKPAEQVKTTVLRTASKQTANTTPANQPRVLNYTINVKNFNNEKEKAQNESEKEKGKFIENNKLVFKTVNKKDLKVYSRESMKQAAEKNAANGNNSDEDSKNTLSFLVIKDEPIEWSEVSQSELDIMEEKEIYNDIAVKNEIYTDEESMDQTTNDNSQELYTPLTCELCTETYTNPREWVRHVQTHTDMLPAKRKRRDADGLEHEHDSYPALHCDLCLKYFQTPAEWVKHIQGEHTEFELHLSNKNNKNKSSEFVKRAQTLQASSHLKKCNECDKTFPSHASMVIHQRTHTGEQPYSCDYCFDNHFNVKSNLLRHLRTVHDKILSPSDLHKSTGGTGEDIEEEEDDD